MATIKRANDTKYWQECEYKTAFENWQFPGKLHICLSNDSASPLLGIYQGERSTHVQKKDLSTNVHTALLLITKIFLETTQMSNRRMNKKMMVYSYIALLLHSKKKEQTT